MINKIEADIRLAKRLLSDPDKLAPCASMAVEDIHLFVQRLLRSVSDNLELIGVAVKPGVGVEARWLHVAGGPDSHVTQMMPIVHSL